jgi:2-desacetyl-2-hydroxyethyl bacteriochlorophyllide A dehydrogenase
MPKWLVNVLFFFYSRVPPAHRPALKRAFTWLTLRAQAIATFRSVHGGRRVEFLGYEIAHLESFELLSPGRHEVLVEARASCVSPGTERAVLMGLPGARRVFPYVPGYSVVGTVKKVGDGIKGIAVGDRVAGRMSHASHGLMTPKSLFKVPDGVDAEQAAFMELGVITLQGIRKATIRPGERVAVIGQGIIGAMAARAARVVGAGTIVAVASSRRRMGPALKPGGADEFVSISEEPAKLDALLADVTIEAVGSSAAIHAAMRATRPGGRVVLLGSARDLGRGVDWWSLAQQRSLTVFGAHISDVPAADASAGRWTYAQEGKLFLDLLAAKRLDVADLITWRPRPEDCNAVYEVLAAGGGEHVAIVFQWAPAAA